MRGIGLRSVALSLGFLVTAARGADDPWRVSASAGRFRHNRRRRGTIGQPCGFEGACGVA